MQKGDLRIVNKGVQGLTDMQTEADRASQDCIIQSLQKKFGGNLSIIGEENHGPGISHLELRHSSDVLHLNDICPPEFKNIKQDEVVIWVDPLDGTSEFLRAAKGKTSVLEQVTILIGIAYRGRPIAGVIHQPYWGQEQPGRTLWGVVGMGVHGLKLSQTQPNRIAVSSKSHSTPLVNEALEALKSIGLISEVQKVGGAGFKVLKCLEDAAAYVYANSGCKKWDTAAPEAVLLAAGGKLSDISGRLLYYGVDAQLINTGGVIATANWVNHQDYVSAIPDSIKSLLPEYSSAI